MENTILKPNLVMKTGNEVFAGIITKDNVVQLALLFTISIVAHDLITYGYGVDIEAENKKVKVSFKPREYYSQAV
ncbi:MAG: hypothetical protein KZY87_10035 [Lachnospiraceae bacterium]|nr:hypothetical protein [Lachnospiraceae bacterium]